MHALRWRPRNVPLPIRAVAAQGKAAERLMRRLLDEYEGLTGVAGHDLVVISGPEDALPWVDGAQYLGRDDRAPSLLMPTSVEPDVHPALLERAALAQGVPAPIAFLLAPACVVSSSESRPLTRASVQAWLEVHT